jgi:hypothetical protein
VKATFWSVLICVLALGASAADAPALDAAKYPQDTPQNALKSIIAAFEAKDFAYWLTHLLRPEDSARIIEKNGGLDKAVANNADPAKASRREAQLATMKKILAAKTSEGERNGIKFFRFIDEGKVAQFEQQADKRWCMNIRVSSEQNMDNPDAPKAPEAKKDEPKK